MIKKIFFLMVIILVTICLYSESPDETMEYYAYMSCGKCVTILQELKDWIRNNGKNIEVKVYEFSDSSSRTRLDNLNEKYNIYKEYPLLPVLIYGDRYYSGREEIERFVHNREAPVHIMYDLSLGLMISAGLLDGINPCVFTIIVLLISYMFVNLKSRKLILLSGVFYIITVFITYYLIGLGILGAIRSLSFIPLFSKIFKYVLAVFLFVLAGVSMIDFIKLAVLKDGSDKMILKLPDFFQDRIRQSIRLEMKDYRIILSSIFLGFSVTLLELLCTGGIYFPAVATLTRLDRQFTGLLYLFVYNLAFIVPLLAIFILVFIGVSSKRIGEFLGNKTVFIKMGFFILFAVFGVFTLIF